MLRVFMPFLWLSQHTGPSGMVKSRKTRSLRFGHRVRPIAIPRAETPGSALAIGRLSLNDLREAIRSNRVSFPAQVPIFPKHDRPDLQRKMVQLYFVLGWSCGAIASRYGMIRQRVQQILNTWKRRAVEMGYIQHIPEQTTLEGAKFSHLPVRRSAVEAPSAQLL